MTITIPVLLLLIGLAMVFGRKAPVIPIAAVFLVVGLYSGDTWIGERIVSGFNQLTRIIE